MKFVKKLNLSSEYLSIYKSVFRIGRIKAESQTTKPQHQNLFHEL